MEVPLCIGYQVQPRFNDVFHPDLRVVTREGELNKGQWDVFAALVRNAERSLEVAREIGLESPDVDQTLVTGIRGLLTLIAGAFAAKTALGEKVSATLATRIATLLK